MHENNPRKAYLSAVERIRIDENASILDKIASIHSLFVLLVEELVSVSNISFSTLFAQVTYLRSYYRLDNSTIRTLHLFRKLYKHRKQLGDDAQEELFSIGIHIVVELSRLLNDAHERLKIASFPDGGSDGSIDKHSTYIHFMRGCIVSIDSEKYLLEFVHEDSLDTYSARYNVTGVNELFTTVIQAFANINEYPITTQLIHVMVDEERIVTPRLIILEPDYLIDATSVAESFKGRSTYPLLTMLRRFLPIKKWNMPLLVGNIANTILDELIDRPEMLFHQFIPMIFSRYNSLICMYNDDEVRSLLDTVHKHFSHIKTVVNHHFAKENIVLQDTYTEPSFYSVKYGLQGRLDVLHQGNKTVDIVELKSGSPFMPNSYGLSSNHYIQTLMYDLMIESTRTSSSARRQYILYSKVKDGLKYAPAVTALQEEALSVRNSLAYLDRRLSTSAGVHAIVNHLDPVRFTALSGFIKKDLETFSKTIKTLDEMEYAYFVEMVAFMAREQRLSKMGRYGRYADGGLSSLWTHQEEEKEERFSLLKKCTIHKVVSDDTRSQISLIKSSETSKLSNFRVGDVVVLYPYRERSLDNVRSQIFKCTIVDISAKQITVQLRGKIYNKNILDSVRYWSLEPDTLDSSFMSAYRSLFGYLRKHKTVRRLLLGRIAPRKYTITESYLRDDSLTTEQNDICRKAISSKDYFLIWGPPGTGKTSVVLKKIVDLYLANDEVTLILAYTNRAVDEICRAISPVGKYLRVGSYHACDPMFRDDLLDERMKGCGSRKEILSILAEHRIFVATVASMLNRDELFQLIPFSRLIVDEASQILEPVIINILARSKHWILIGDHRQLPAVVAQTAAESEVQNAELRTVGVTNMRLSFFERLYRQCLDNGWSHAIGMLSRQGRMHLSIVAFVNAHFYKNKLQSLSMVDRLFVEDGYLVPLGTSERTLFVDLPTDDTVDWKTNIHEARAVIHILDLVMKYYETQDIPLLSDAIGIITPYRAQIALIKSLLEETVWSSRSDRISVDTVERYQGSARDIIIYSLCTNNSKQFGRLAVLDDDGIDRKLNVAITRARDYIFVLGNERVMRTVPIYSDLVDGYTKYELEVI